MKKPLLLVFLLAIAALPALAQTDNNTEENTAPPVPALYESEEIAEPDSLPPAPPGPPAAIQEMKQEKSQERLGDTAAPAQTAEKSKAKTKGQNNGQGETRRSRVANAVEALLMVAERSGGIGPQVREIAREQIQLADQAENKLDQAKKTNKLNKFFWGADYRTLKEAGKDLKGIDRSLRKLEALAIDPAITADDKALIDAQVSELNTTRTELLAKVKAEADGFALFGWLAKILNGYNVGE